MFAKEPGAPSGHIFLTTPTALSLEPGAGTAPQALVVSHPYTPTFAKKTQPFADLWFPGLCGHLHDLDPHHQDKKLDKCLYFNSLNGLM